MTANFPQPAENQTLALANMSTATYIPSLTCAVTCPHSSILGIYYYPGCGLLNVGWGSLWLSRYSTHLQQNGRLYVHIVNSYTEKIENIKTYQLNSHPY